MTCAIDGCHGVVLARGWCSKHYSRWSRHGDPQKGERAPAKNYVLKLAGIDPSVTECIPWPFSTDSDGRARIHRDSFGSGSVANVLCRLVHGEPPTPDHEAAHSCGNGHLGCSNPYHLSWKTHYDNMQDAVAHGTMNRGVTNHNARLTEADVLAIRQMSGPAKPIADRYGVSPRAIYSIRSSRTWAWLQ